MENLTLPELAAGLWAAKRSVLHAIPPRCSAGAFPRTSAAARSSQPAGSTGSVPTSTCSFPAGTTLIDLLQDNHRNIVNQLGGNPEAVAGGRVKIAFENGFLDISNFRPDPPCGHAIATVDGQLEKVLSSHQILCGTLCRVDQLLVRDVFDVLNAADEDPAALAATAGMVSKQRTAAIESAWRNAAGMLADNFHDSIRSSRRDAGTGLGPEAAAAFQAHRYTRLEIDLHSDTLSIRKTIPAGPLEPQMFAARNARRALVESGVATHLNINGPVTVPQVLAAMRRGCSRSSTAGRKPPGRHRPDAPVRSRHRGGARDDRDPRSRTTPGPAPGASPRDRNTPKIETRRISDLQTLGSHET